MEREEKERDFSVIFHNLPPPPLLLELSVSWSWGTFLCQSIPLQWALLKLGISQKPLPVSQETGTLAGSVSSWQ